MTEDNGAQDLVDAAAPDAPAPVIDAAPPADNGKADRRVSDPKAAGTEVSFAPVKCLDNQLFCEDFEAGALDPARWIFGSGVYYYTSLRGVAIDVDAAQARGKHALRVRRTEPMGEEQGLDTGDGFKRTGMQFPLGAGTLFVRFFIFIDDPTPNRWFSTFFLSDPAKDRMNEGVWGANLVPQDETKAYPSLFEVGDQVYSRQLAPLGRWACWELELRGADKQVLFYVDGKPVQGVESTAMPYAPDKVQLNFGYHGQHADILKHPPDGFFDMWFDDIAVAKQRIGCSL